MLKKLIGIATIILTGLLVTAHCQQSIINTTKSNVKDYKNGAVSKDHGPQLLTPVTLTIGNPADLEALAAGRLPVNFTLKNAASGQTVRVKMPAFSLQDKSINVTVYVAIDNLLAPLGEGNACVDTALGAAAASDGSINITLDYAACGPAGKRQHKPYVINRLAGPINIVQGDTEACDNAAAAYKLKMNPSNNGVTAEARVTPTTGSASKLKMNPSSNGITGNVVLVTSSRGSGSPKQAGF